MTAVTVPRNCPTCGRFATKLISDVDEAVAVVCYPCLNAGRPWVIAEIPGPYPACAACGRSELCFGVDDDDVEDGTYQCEYCDHCGTDAVPALAYPGDRTYPHL